jgi:hypothetical protein
LLHQLINVVFRSHLGHLGLYSLRSLTTDG